jgi:opacity protein-like surface antigen
MHRIVCLTILAPLLMQQQLVAGVFDHQREGFTLGFGLGPGVVMRTVSPGFSTDGEQSTAFSVLANVKVGYAPSRTLVLNFIGTSFIFGEEGNIISNGVSAVGVTYYLDPVAPSWFLTGGLGSSSWDVITKSQYSMSGFGLVFGAGYEFSRHWSVELMCLWANHELNSDSYVPEANRNPVSIGMAISVTNY